MRLEQMVWARRMTCALTLIMSFAIAAEPIPIIFDTDIGNDVDDAMALALIHELMDRDEVELLAVTISKDNPWAAVYTDVINTFYGRPDIPIGRVVDGKIPQPINFIRPISERTENGTLVYPRDVGPDTELPEAVSLMRRILAGRDDKRVKIISVGYLTNLGRLLESEPDEASTLNGIDLVKATVSECVLMAGAFSSDPNPEFNAFVDPSATRRVFESWPTPLVTSGFEVGLAILYPATSIEQDYQYVKDHPVAEAYRLYKKMPHDRPTFDLNSVLYAARPDRGYYGLSKPGKITLNDKNITEFEEVEGGLHRYQTVMQDQIVQVSEVFVQMVSSPPGW